jgi:hypothetical protein
MPHQSTRTPSGHDVRAVFVVVIVQDRIGSLVVGTPRCAVVACVEVPDDVLHVAFQASAVPAVTKTKAAMSKRLVMLRDFDGMDMRPP